MLRRNLRRCLPFFIGGLIFVLLGVIIWQSLRPHWKTFVSPPLADGSRLTFRYPADWSLNRADDSEVKGMKEIILQPVPPNAFVKWAKERFAPPPRVAPTVSIFYFIAEGQEPFTSTIERDEAIIYKVSVRLKQRRRSKSLPLPQIRRQHYPFAEALRVQWMSPSLQRPGICHLSFYPAHPLSIDDISVSSQACSQDWQRTCDAAEAVAQSLRLRK